MSSIRTMLIAIPTALIVTITIACLPQDPEPRPAPPIVAPKDSSPPRTSRPLTDQFCARCHAAIAAEHAQNTHGRAYTDEEVRLATGRFDHGDCIRCHTPRPIFETGIGMNPIRRHHDLESGINCMSCHRKEAYNYRDFQGGAECTRAFDKRVGEVEACASCHRNHGTPYQWEIAPTGKLAGKKCIDCHMRWTKRPVAVGEAPRKVRSHVFPGSRSRSQLRKAYHYDARIEGNEVVVTIKNRGAGHHFPTELKQRALESLVKVLDASGKEVYRSRMVFRDPYKRPYGLTLQVNTQILPGKSRTHRVPLKLESGTVQTELHFKLYYPIEDYHPGLARRLEARTLVFSGVSPSPLPVESAPEVPVRTPESMSPEAASPANLVDFAHPPIGTVKVDFPGPDDPDRISRLIQLFQFPVPEANEQARHALVEIGMPALPALVEALGSWDNKTWKQAMTVLTSMGAPALPAVLAGTGSEQLYIRYHARRLLPRMGWLGRNEAALHRLTGALEAPGALDRISAAEALGRLGITSATPLLRPLLEDDDPDVVRAAALALARLQDHGAVDAMGAALKTNAFFETRRDLAYAMAFLGDPRGIPVLLDGLDHRDDLLRESAFERFFAVTGVHMGYEPRMDRPRRLAALARLRAWWTARGGVDRLKKPRLVPADKDARAWALVKQLGASHETRDGGSDATREALLALGDDAVPALIRGLKFPPGFAARRAGICELLGTLASPAGAPALEDALRDPVLSVAAWACWALERVRDRATLPALVRYQDRLQTLVSHGRVPTASGHPDLLLTQAARSRLLVGDGKARSDLIRFLLSDHLPARRLAIDALETKYGETRGYVADAPLDQRRAAAAAWMPARAH